MASEPEVQRGEIWSVALDPSIGSEQQKTRPCAIVQRDSANRRSGTTIICPLTSGSASDANLLNVFVSADASGLAHDSLVLCNQIRVVDRVRLRGAPVGRLDSRTLALVETGLRAILDLGK